ncbi:hypothetical protein HER10_EVM0005687 [Colletotrichum scovillei]|uniref:Transcription regulator n=1 Tax=Colletotrichum scovillei TaxID=1209932 RepID=A0A9P7RI36_9PEZI|nr:uncharacterized protein HER10_EVM0005687 [Colletotrichum scovillei]KAF4779658.1 hypothetical protein HER10_EVM0005687 [Colletotrichum scovillei]KAG7057613.1 Transcription regulator [Colletotrichum scovillei]KAG7076210.1 Transcription regulator [Colletotrichum scovillei]KAG7083205.1 Transcription regulator [Colletotrichum scovillei]
MNFTSTLLTTHKSLFHTSTTATFLAAAARGKVPKPILGRWLANDRLYIHAYIKGAGRFLAQLDLPDVVEPSSHHDISGHDAGSPTVTNKAADKATAPVTERLLNWLVDALVNVRREERFFIDVAARFGIDVNLPAEPASESGSSSTNRRVKDEDKNAGLLAFERLFTSIATTPPRGVLLPWLAPAVLFWATEKCYLEAWSGARNMLPSSGSDISAPGASGNDTASDLDGGALRTEFIPNWSSSAFRAFVDELAAIIDDGVDEAVRLHGEEAVRSEIDQARVTWREVLLAENDFWPGEMEEGGLRRVPSD